MLLRLEIVDDLLGHPFAGLSWEGFVIGNLLRVAPEIAAASFIRTAAGAEIDLILDLPGNQRWAVEISGGTAPKLSRGFHHAMEDLAPDRAFIVHSGDDRYPKGGGVLAIGLRELGQKVASLAQSHMD